MTWSLVERRQALLQAEREGLDLLVVGGGITGAGVLRDAASRGLRVLLVERDDFAAGTSSRSSKFVHGGLRYIGEGQLRMTREACRERDLLLSRNPNLVRRLSFLFPAYVGGKMPLWQVRTGLWIYSGLANFRRSSRFRMLRPEQVADFCPDLNREGLRGAGLFWDAQVDDARLVLEALRSARAFGGEAANHAEVVGFDHDAHGRIIAARIRDQLDGGILTLRAHTVVNATGAAVERLCDLDSPVKRTQLRPAKGVHLVIPGDRIPTRGSITFEAADGRYLFLSPWDEVAILGTTDDFSDEIDEPVVTIEEVHYLLSAANEAFPTAALTTNDLRSVFAGVRPLIAPPDADAPPSSVSREHRIWENRSGLISVAGGKLTTFRSMGEAIVDRLVPKLPPSRRAAAGPSQTAACALREDRFDRAELEATLMSRFGVDPRSADYLVRTYGARTESLLEQAPPELRRPIGRSRFMFAEIPWSFQTECPATLCDLLERRMRLAIFAVGQGIADLEEIASVAGEAAGWDPEQTKAEAAGYIAAVRCRYQIQIGNAASGRPRPAAA